MASLTELTRDRAIMVERAQHRLMNLALDQAKAAQLGGLLSDEGLRAQVVADRVAVGVLVRLAHGQISHEVTQTPTIRAGVLQ